MTSSKRLLYMRARTVLTTMAVVGGVVAVLVALVLTGMGFNRLWSTMAALLAFVGSMGLGRYLGLHICRIRRRKYLKVMPNGQTHYEI